MALENKMKQGKGYLDSAKRIHWSYQIPFFNNTTIQVYAPIANAKEAEVDQFNEDREHLKKMFYSSLGIGMQK